MAWNFRDDEITDRDAEVYAAALWDVMRATGEWDHCKAYDPLTMETKDNGQKIAHTYIFDLWDGGRHHEVTGMRRLCEAMLTEAVGNIRPQTSSILERE